MLLSAVATHVRNSIGDRGGIFASDELIILSCNEAVLDIYRKTDVGATNFTTETLAAGTATWTPNNLLRINTIFNNTSKRHLEEKTLDWITEFHGIEYYVERGDPIYYFKYLASGGTAITVVPTPEQATDLVINWTALPTEFNDIADNLADALPTTYHYDVVRFCVMRAHEREKDFRAAEKAQEHYETNLADRRAEAHKLDDSYSTISPDPYDYI